MTVRRWRVLVLVVGMAVVGLLGVLASDDGTTEDGYRVVSDAIVSIGSADGRVWRGFDDGVDQARPGFPPPVISTLDGLCLGFARVDFEGPPRPSLARCVAADDLPEVALDELSSVLRVRSGLDVWHLIVFGRPVSEVVVTTGDGDEIDPARVHLDERHAAIRIPTDADIAGIEWVDGRLRHRCDAAPPVDAAAVDFCALRPA